MDLVASLVALLSDLNSADYAERKDHFKWLMLKSLKNAESRSNNFQRRDHLFNDIYDAFNDVVSSFKNISKTDVEQILERANFDWDLPEVTFEPLEDVTIEETIEETVEVIEEEPIEESIEDIKYSLPTFKLCDIPEIFDLETKMKSVKGPAPDYTVTVNLEEDLAKALIASLEPAVAESSSKYAEPSSKYAESSTGSAERTGDKQKSAKKSSKKKRKKKGTDDLDKLIESVKKEYGETSIVRDESSDEPNSIAINDGIDVNKMNSPAILRTVIQNDRKYFLQIAKIEIKKGICFKEMFVNMDDKPSTVLDFYSVLITTTISNIIARGFLPGLEDGEVAHVHGSLEYYCRKTIALVIMAVYKMHITKGQVYSLEEPEVIEDLNAFKESVRRVKLRFAKTADKDLYKPCLSKITFGNLIKALPSIIRYMPYVGNIAQAKFDEWFANAPEELATNRRKHADEIAKATMYILLYGIRYCWNLIEMDITRIPTQTTTMTFTDIVRAFVVEYELFAATTAIPGNLCSIKECPEYINATPELRTKMGLKVIDCCMGYACAGCDECAMCKL